MSWYQSLGLQFIALLALVLGVLLAAFAAYVHIKRNTYTEKRFSFYAFLACCLLATSSLFVLFNVSPWEPLLRYLGLPVEPASFSDKALGVGFVLGFMALASHWARSWNGQLTQSGAEARLRGEQTSFLSDGLTESFRMIRRAPRDPLFVERRKVLDGIRLASPLIDLPFHEQVLDLAQAAWPELLVERNAWTAETRTWRGTNAALDQPFWIVCCVDQSEWNSLRLREQFHHGAKAARLPRLVLVIDNDAGREQIQTDLISMSPDVEIIKFDDLISRALPLAQYRREIARQFAEQDLPNASFPAKKIFAPASIRTVTLALSGQIRESDVVEQFEAHITTWIEGDQNRQIALLGDYGQGKSTAVLALTYRMLFDEAFARATGGRLPILVRLTGQSPKTSSPEELLSAWGGRFGLNGRALLALHRAGRTLLIFDAFDEMANVSDHADRIDHFSMLWRFACPTGKVLFTGRPNFFLDDEELKNALRVGEASASGAYCQALRIQPFDLDQMKIALRWMEPYRLREFIKAVTAQAELLSLVRRPSFLFQVSRLWHLGLLRIDSDTVYSANVILDFISYSLDRQVDKQVTDISHAQQAARFIPLRRSELDYFVSGCAIAALSGGRSNSLSAVEYRKTIAELIERAPESWFGLTTHDGGSVGLPLSERIPDLEKRIESCAHAVRTHGVLELDPARADHYKFSHKSFAEALAANAIVAGG
ncbi:MAG: hypothetical protein EPO55_10010 [Reyranella sp.]|uniref:NACHT domain-containing protein n=1 Tax=Reyranella sp. TaxID=1929291 RepID=UPI00122BEC1D|nr:hypothetical protein [Reyranella sp.]TAJ40068.1 MAG: hypothetical protein EPO55_10010 [Reyranella sp.]